MQFLQNSATLAIIFFLAQLLSVASYQTPHFTGNLGLTLNLVFCVFKGNCVVEYQFDPSATTSAVLVGKTAPQLISTYFKQSAFSGPVDLTYVNFADASNSNFKLNLLSRVSYAQLCVPLQK